MKYWLYQDWFSILGKQCEYVHCCMWRFCQCFDLLCVFFFLYLKGNISNMCLFVPMWTVQLFQQTTLLLQSLSWRRRALLLWQLMKNWTLWCLRVSRRPEACGWKSVPQPDMGVLLAVDSTDLEWKRVVWVTWQSFNKLLTNEAECSPWEIT